MTVFVTGGAGYIGSICVEQLLEAGHRVAVFDNLSEGHRAAVDLRAQLFVGDLLDPTTLGRAMRAVEPHAVLHLAASALVSESMKAPEKYFSNNVSAGIRLMDAMIETGVKRLVFSSSCATYGLPWSVPIDESTDQIPINPYGESKLMFEQMIQWYERAHGITSIGLRFFNVAGASETRGEDHRVETHLIPNILKVALGQKSQVDVYGTDYETTDGTSVRDYVHVLDIASAHLVALTAPIGGFFNVGNGCGYSVAEVIEKCREVTGHPIPLVARPRRPGDPAQLVANSQKIRAAFRWRPSHSSLDQLVESAWQWHLRHPRGYGCG